MSEETVLSTHELTIRFVQLENGTVNWHVQPDEKIEQTLGLSVADLAGCGAPLAAMGIRVLLNLCMDGLVLSALGQANEVQTAAVRRMLADGDGEAESLPNGVTIQ